MKPTGLPTRRRFLQTVTVAVTVPAVLRANSSPAPAHGEHRVITANIRVPLPADEESGNGWAARRRFCADVIRAREPDIVCLQEALLGPVQDLCADLGGGFREFGFHGPEMDARREGYQLIAKNPILYSAERYDLVSAGGFWLSETPHLPATMSWGSARARHVNWVRLRDRSSQGEFRVLNTHLDHESQPAREKQLAMILAEAAAYEPGFPQLFAGDFNVDAHNPAFGLVRDAGWSDAYAAIHGTRDDGPTAHAFRGPAGPAKSGRIDFLLTRGAVKPTAAEIIRDSREGRFPSDHYFVFAAIAIA